MWLDSGGGGLRDTEWRIWVVWVVNFKFTYSQVCTCDEIESQYLARDRRIVTANRVISMVWVSG